MSHLRQTVLAIALATTAIGAWALTDAQHQHQANVLATEQATTAEQGASAATPASAGMMTAMDAKMKAMGEMHQKMMNAKTPEERKALMAEHMKTMQEGMKMMGMMGGAGMAEMPGNMGQHHQMMEKRMAMMEAMMQMMMDRMAAPAAN
ncbi:MAG: hypothetical protein ACD_23C01161G0001 [uncultured bacterium]|nr:MAG: hypothetical protein ACD_23C01161G0001 [uncultured bacterium]